MANPNNTSGRSGLRRGLSELVDRMFLGNRAHDFQSGYWNRQGAIEGGIQGVAGQINPLLGFGVNAYYRLRDRRNNAPMQLGQTQLDPTQRVPFNYQSPQLGGFGAPQVQSQFDPNNPFAMPQQPQQPQGQPTSPNWGRFTPNLQPAPTGFQSMLSNQMGGARGMHNQGGHTGDAARAMFDGMRRASAFAPIDTGPPRQS